MRLSCGHRFYVVDSKLGCGILKDLGARLLVA